MRINISAPATIKDDAGTVIGTITLSGSGDIDVPAPSPGPSPSPEPVPPPVPSWNVTTLPVQNFQQGVAKKVDLRAFVDNMDPTVKTFAAGGPVVPGLTGDPVGLAYSGAGPAPSSTAGVWVDIVDIPAPTPPSPSPSPPPSGSDWQSRATEGGVVHAQNFSALASAADVYNLYHVGLMASRGFGPSPKTPSMGATFDPNAYELVSTPGHAASGKAFRLWQGKNGYGGAGELDNQWFCIPFNGANIATDPAGAYLPHAYVQFTVWTDSFLDYYWKLAGGDVGTCKLAILDYFAGAGNTGEAVITNHHNLGFVTCYANVGGYIVGKGMNTPAYQGNVALNPSIDNGGALTDQNSFERRYGPFEHGMTGGQSQATRLSAQGNPDTDALIGVGPGYAWNRGGLTTVEVEVQLSPPRIRFWAAPAGQVPKLLGDTLPLGGFDPGSRNDGLGYGVGWSGLTLSNLIYTATGAQNPGYPSDAYVDYSEIIISRNPIKFPGGFALP